MARFLVKFWVWHLLSRMLYVSGEVAWLSSFIVLPRDVRNCYRLIKAFRLKNVLKGFLLLGIHTSWGRFCRYSPRDPRNLGSLDECAHRETCLALGIIGNSLDLLIHTGTKATFSSFRIHLPFLTRDTPKQYLVFSESLSPSFSLVLLFNLQYPGIACFSH